MEHEDKANAFWHCYKTRMGVSNATSDIPGLEDVITRVANLEHLSLPFSSEEIENVVKFLKPDRAPCPDGFTGLFFKQCWGIIKGDFYKLCSDFSAGKVSLQNINGSYITLIPKKTTPETVSD